MMTAEDREWIVAKVSQMLLEERERVAKAAGMSADLTKESPYENDSSAMVMADFARRLRVGE